MNIKPEIQKNVILLEGHEMNTLKNKPVCLWTILGATIIGYVMIFLTACSSEKREQNNWI